jgi:hypothetical protein
MAGILMKSGRSGTNKLPAQEQDGRLQNEHQGEYPRKAAGDSYDLETARPGINKS